MELLSFIAVILAIAGCGGGTTTPTEPPRHEVSWLYPNHRIAGVHQRTVGHGVRGAVVLWSRTTPNPPRRVVIFLHGYQALPPITYRGWLHHLAAAGNSIIYPVYQRGSTPASAYLKNALSGIAAGLKAVKADPRTLVAVGHTIGGALAFGYAASARSDGLPAPRAVVAIYPGRNPPTGEVPVGDLSHIPASTRLEVISGAGNPLPDSMAQARRLLAGATRVPGSRRAYTNARDLDRFGPLSSDEAARSSFWAPTDRAIAQARRVDAKPPEPADRLAQ